jgi:hypothetical protein
VPAEVDRVQTAEVIAALSLATDLGIGVPLEHGLQSTLYAMRLADRLGVDEETGSHTYYACLLFYVGCTAGAETATELFGDEQALTTYGSPVRFGSCIQMMGGIVRAIAPPGQPVAARAVRLESRLPKAARAFPEQVATFCQVAQMLTDGLGLPPRSSRCSRISPNAGTAKGTRRARGQRRFHWPCGSPTSRTMSHSSAC